MLARELGATHTLESRGAEALAEIRKIIGGGTDFGPEASPVPAVFRLGEDETEMDRLQLSENFTRDLRDLRWMKSDGRGCHRHECLRSRGLQREKRIGAYPRGYPGETLSIGLERTDSPRDRVCFAPNSAPRLG